MTSTITKPEYLGHVEGVGHVYQIALPFHEQLESFAAPEVRASLTNIANTARIRIAKRNEGGKWFCGTRTDLVALALKGEPTILTKIPMLTSPIMAEAIVTANRNGRYLEQPAEVFESARDLARLQVNREPEDRDTIILTGTGDYDITPEMIESKFAFGEATRPYFATFAHSSIHLSNLRGVSTEYATLNYVWFGNPLGGSVLILRGRSLDSRQLYGDGDGWDGVRGCAFGVRAEGASNEAIGENLGYSLTDIRDANVRAVAKFLQEKGMVGLVGNLSGLEDVFLNELEKSKYSNFKF